MRIRRMTAPPDLREFDEKIAQVRRDKESAIDSQDFEKAAALRDNENQLIAKKDAREKEWKAGDMDAVAEVNEDLIAEVLAIATGIPVFKLTEEESQRLLRMEDELHKRVIGQNVAIKALSQAIRRTRAGLKDPKRPGGSFIFAGPSGVGKTELSKTLAEFLFGDEDSLIQLDMSEYMDKHTVSRLFGSPPGYVGYEEGGQLTEKGPQEAVLRRPVRRDREGPPGHLQLPPPDPGGGAPHRRAGPGSRLQEHGDHHDHQPGHQGHLQGGLPWFRPGA
jgi:ATP-dependent Clp protease ATP-binding subunit ClpC